MKLRSLKYDEEFIKNNPEIINELINLKEPIPMRIHSIVSWYYPDINTRRSLVIGDDVELEIQVRQERFVARKLGGLKAREYHNDLALEFIKKHPKFAPIIKEIKYIEI